MKTVASRRNSFSLTEMSKLFPKGVKKQLGKLNRITTGPGALKLPEKISGITLRFDAYVKQPCVGSKQFWRSHLPAIQFYNPTVPISVQRYTDNSQPELVIKFDDGTSKSMDIKGKNVETILEAFIQESKATAIAENEQVKLGESEY